jgi:hypothetical protein
VELWSSGLSLLGGKQTREQPAGWWHRLIRIIGVDARKCRDMACKAAHRAWTVRGRGRRFRRTAVEHRSLRCGSRPVQMLDVLRERRSCRRLGYGPSPRRQMLATACEGKGIVSVEEGTSAIGRKSSSNGTNGAAAAGVSPGPGCNAACIGLSGRKPARAAAQSVGPPAESN